MRTLNLPAVLPIKPRPESPACLEVIRALGLHGHPEGGYFLETDRDAATIPNAFRPDSGLQRSLSSTIFYFLTPTAPVGAFHANRARTIHTLHKGRALYVIIRAGEHSGAKGEITVESFVAGHGLVHGERLQFVVEAGDWKACYLLEGSDEGMLMGETVVPGFDFQDHEFLTKEQLQSMASENVVEEFQHLLKQS
jgi:predicted cupin superfamily sugar epimerase